MQSFPKHTAELHLLAFSPEHGFIPFDCAEQASWKAALLGLKAIPGKKLRDHYSPSYATVACLCSSNRSGHLVWRTVQLNRNYNASLLPGCFQWSTLTHFPPEAHNSFLFLSRISLLTWPETSLIKSQALCKYFHLTWFTVRNQEPFSQNDHWNV